MLISPSVLACDLSRLAEEAATVDCADMLHIDVMDGRFVPNISFGIPVIASLRNKTKLLFDVHLMIQSPYEYIEAFKKSGADLITVHYESDNSVAALRRVKELGLKAGLSIKPSTPVSAVEKLLPECDLVLVMTVEPGFGGQKLMSDCLLKAAELKKIRQDNGYSYLIEADGGIDFGNLKAVGDSGVDVAVMGSAVFRLLPEERNDAICVVNGRGR